MAEEENEDIEVIDVSLNEDEIDEMIAHLIELKEHKKNVQFPLASDLDLSVTYSNEIEETSETTTNADSAEKLVEVKEVAKDAIVKTEEIKHG